LERDVTKLSKQQLDILSEFSLPGEMLSDTLSRLRKEHEEDVKIMQDFLDRDAEPAKTSILDTITWFWILHVTCILPLLVGIHYLVPKKIGDIILGTGLLIVIAPIAFAVLTIVVLFVIPDWITWIRKNPVPGIYSVFFAPVAMLLFYLNGVVLGIALFLWCVPVGYRLMLLVRGPILKFWSERPWKK